MRMFLGYDPFIEVHWDMVNFGTGRFWDAFGKVVFYSQLSPMQTWNVFSFKAPTSCKLRNGKKSIGRFLVIF